VAHENPNCGENLGFTGAAPASLQHPAEGELVVSILVYVRDPQLGLPKERVICALEYLSLLGDAVDHGLQRGTSIRGAEGSGLDVGADLFDAAT